MFRQALEVARVDLRRRMRSRSALITAIVAPLALAVVFGSLLGGAPEAAFEIGVVAEGGSPVADDVADALLGFVDDPESDESTVAFVEMESAGSARDELDEEDVDAALVLRPAADGRENALTVLVLSDPDKPIATQIAESVAASVAGDVERASLGIAAVTSLDATSLTEETLQSAMSIPRSVAIAEGAVGGQQFSPMAYFGAGMAILLLFFTVGSPARAVIVDREKGTLDRMMAGGVAPASILGGYVLAAALLAVIGFVTVWLVTALAFGANWGRPLPVFVLIVATVAAIAGVAMFVGSLARTQRQADSYASIVAFVFAFLGGNFVGPANTGAVLQRLKMLTPNGWSLDGFVALSADEAGLGRLLPALAALLAFAAAFGTIGLMRVQRGMAR